MNLIEPDTLRSFIKLALKPIVIFSLRNSVKLAELVECLKEVLVEQAQQELQTNSSKQNNSRVSLMTGVHRRDIKRFSTDQKIIGDKSSIITKIVNQWSANPKYQNKNGSPKILTLDSDNNEFQELVYSVSKEYNPAALLFELERVKAIEKTPKGIKLAKQEYIPSGNISESLGILAQDSEDLYSAALENIFYQEELPNLHRRTFYDNIVPEALPKIKAWFFEEGVKFHKRARTFLEEYDRDFNPKLNKGGSNKKFKVVLSSFSRIFNSGE